MRCTKYFWLTLLATIVIDNCCAQTEAYVIPPQRVSSWENVTGFDINAEGNYMVVSLRVNNREQLFESKLDGGLWSTPVSIEPINSFKGNTSSIGGPFIYFDERVLYFHANYPEGQGGYDLYYSVRQGNSWSEPESLGLPINSSSDEFHPSVPPGLQKIYFSRGNPTSEAKRPSRAPFCETFYESKKTLGNWGSPKPLHDALNKGCQYGVRLMDDGKTVFFSAVDQDNPKEGYNLYFARELSPGSWIIPSPIEGVTSEKTNINPRIIGDNLYFIEQIETRKDITGIIYRTLLPEKYKPLKTVIQQGKIVQLDGKKPLQAPLTVFDPITLNVIGEYQTDRYTGDFSMMLLDGANYIVDVRNQGFSFASYNVDLSREEKKLAPKQVELFNEIELDISVFDKEIFRPLQASVWVEALSDNNRRFDAQQKSDGLFAVKLPIGHNYRINATANGFEDSSFDFNLFGDIIFSKFERNMPLEPKKKMFEILITDNDTEEAVNAEVTFKNLNREEVISFVTALEGEQNGTSEEPAVPVENLDEISVIPFKNPVNPFRVALIIGNEDYKSYQVGLQSESNVDFAIRDASLFKEYAHSVLGVPQENILFLINGRAMDMHNEVKKLNGIIKALEGKAEVFFYYAGHGFPDEKTKEPYIIPVDVSGSNLKWAIKLNELYAQLTEFPAKRVTVFLDACFSGGARNVGLVSARAVKVKPKENLLKGNLVVFSASSESQTAHPYREKEHGMFTFYVLRKLLETKGNINYRDFTDYIKETVAIRSILINYAEQSPQTNISHDAEESWYKWKFK